MYAEEFNTMISTATREAAILIEPDREEKIGSDLPDSSRSVLLIANNNSRAKGICSELLDAGYNCDIFPYSNALLDVLGEYLIDILVIDMEVIATSITDGLSIVRKLKTSLNIPVIVVVPASYLGKFDISMGINDFIVKPCTSAELHVRIRQVLWKAKDIHSENLIKHGDLVIDMDKYEVSIAGNLIPLSFKEYELFKVLITNRNRVLTREALLNKVWGYDYFGGDRTVDVHIRRLRSKIEDAEHCFIETVRSVGYKFKEV